MPSPLLPVKWEYASIPGGSINQTFLFTGAYALETIDPGALESRIASANAGGGDGDFDEEGRDDVRLITLTGKIMGDCVTDPFSDARDKWDALARALLRGQRGRLWRYSDRYYKCQIKSRKREAPDDGLDYIPWSAVFRAADPYLWNETAETLIHLSSGSYSINTGCSAPCYPTFTVNFTTAGTVTWTHAGQTMALTVPATGLYLVDVELARATGPSGDATTMVTGEWLELYPSATTLDTAYSGGAVSSDTTLTYTKRWTD